jgi:hypothetical protein
MAKCKINKLNFIAEMTMRCGFFFRCGLCYASDRTTHTAQNKPQRKKTEPDRTARRPEPPTPRKINHNGKKNGHGGSGRWAVRVDAVFFPLWFILNATCGPGRVMDRYT